MVKFLARWLKQIARNDNRGACSPRQLLAECPHWNASCCFPKAQPRPVDLAPSGCYYDVAGWSSLVARWAHNPKVASSNLAPATNRFNELRVTSTPIAEPHRSGIVNATEKAAMSSLFSCLCVPGGHFYSKQASRSPTKTMPRKNDLPALLYLSCHANWYKKAGRSGGSGVVYAAIAPIFCPAAAAVLSSGDSCAACRPGSSFPDSLPAPPASTV